MAVNPDGDEDNLNIGSTRTRRTTILDDEWLPIQNVKGKHFRLGKTYIIKLDAGSSTKVLPVRANDASQQIWT